MQTGNTGKPHQERDPTLVRHIYDLRILRPHYDLASVAELAKAIMPHDAEIFGQHSHEYRVGSFSETQHAMEALENDPHYGEKTNGFVGHNRPLSGCFTGNHTGAWLKTRLRGLRVRRLGDKSDT